MRDALASQLGYEAWLDAAAEKLIKVMGPPP
jgi:hypothetical protein